MVCLHLSLDVYSCSYNNVCTHLSLGLFSCTTTNETQVAKKRKFVQQATDVVRKKKGCNDIERKLGYTTNLMLYEDPWKIKKEVKESDLKNMSRLSLGRELVENWLRIWCSYVRCCCERGIQVRVLEVDTNSLHCLFWWVEFLQEVMFSPRNGSKILLQEGGLKKGNKIGLHWNSFNNHFNFSVL